MQTTNSELVNKKNISFILYHKNGAPRFYQISKKSFYLYIITPAVVSLFLLISLLGLLFYFSKIRNMASQKDPEMINLLSKENEQVRKDLIDLTDTNKALQNKLATMNSSQRPIDLNAVDVKDNWDTVALFRAPINGPAETFPSFNIEDSEALVQGQKINFRFNIVNLSKDAQKLSGHIFVIMRDDFGIYFYPNSIFEDDDIKINFNRGESFSTTKFRPVEASFPRPNQSSKFLFKVIIFSRTGSLIHKQVFPQDIKL